MGLKSRIGDLTSVGEKGEGRGQAREGVNAKRKKKKKKKKKKRKKDHQRLLPYIINIHIYMYISTCMYRAGT